MKNKWLAGLFVFVFTAMFFCGTTSFAKTANDKIAMGVFLDELNVSGMTKEEALDLVVLLSQFRHIAVKGLMTIAPNVENSEENRPIFRDFAQKCPKTSVYEQTLK